MRNFFCNKSFFWLLLLFAFLLTMSFVSLFFGSHDLSIRDFFAVFFDGSNFLTETILLQIRLPRLLMAIACGFLLGIGGAVLQAWLRNPLADPGLLGVSGGASLGALIAMSLGFGVWLQTLAAASGAVIVVLLLLLCARWLTKYISVSQVGRQLILIGAMVGAITSAIMTLVLITSENQSLRGMLFWLMGDLSGTQLFDGVWVMVFVVFLLGVRLAPWLNVLRLGELATQSLGISVAKIHYLALICVALASAAVVVCAGAVAWVGFLVPHIVRRLMTQDLRWGIPLSGFLGASLLLSADIIARLIIAPQQLPVGVVTSLIGAPVLLFLLLGGRHA